MPKITNFVFCEQIEHEENSPQPIKPINMIPIDNELSKFTILISLVGFEPFEDHTGYLSILDPNGKEVITTGDFHLPKEEDEANFDDKNVMSGASMSIDFGLQFEMQGLYTVELYFDQKKIADFGLPVMKRGSEQ